MKDKRQKMIRNASNKSVARKKPLKKKRKVKISKIRRRILKHTWVVRILIVIGIIVGVYLAILSAEKFLDRTGLTRYRSLASDFVFTPEQKIKSQDGITSILILGRGGADHEAPDLTDTMIVMYVNHEGGLDMVSIPRDIWVGDLRAKLNSVYYWGNQKVEGGGSDLASSVVEDILGTPIHYTAVIDFSGFNDVIDALEGVDVEVKTSFVDNSYPVKGKEDDLCDGDLTYACRYETIEFREGVQTMDAETALKFVRSRSAEGDEGTDIARGIRQQLVIDAIQKEITSKETLTSPSRLLALFEIFNKSVETDLDEGGQAILLRRLYDSRENLERYSIPEELLVNPDKSPEYDNLYVFVPTNGDWSNIHDWVKKIISN